MQILVLTARWRAAGELLVIIPLGSHFRDLSQRDLEFKALAKQEIVTTSVATAKAISTALLGQGVWFVVWYQLGIIL